MSALASAVACGVMIACSFDLVHEGQPYGGALVIAGVVLGKTPSSPFVSRPNLELDPIQVIGLQKDSKITSSWGFLM